MRKSPERVEVLAAEYVQGSLKGPALRRASSEAYAEAEAARSSAEELLCLTRAEASSS